MQTRRLRQRGNGNALVIVEPRNHRLLQKVCENFDKHIDLSWDLYVCYGNLAFAKKATRNVRRRVIYIPLHTTNLTSYEYSSLLKQKSFWNQIQAENILVFQTDSVLCNASMYTMNDFTKFDYIGCSSDSKSVGKSGYFGKEQFYGVGGLSFRKKSFMMQCIKDNPSSGLIAEDVFFSKCVSKSPSSRRPTADDLASFCSQQRMFKKSFGAHKTSIMKKTRKFFKYCPEAKLIT